jgi:hypothetical protein
MADASARQIENLQFMLDNPDRFASELQTINYSNYPESMRPAATPTAPEDAFAQEGQTTGYWDDGSNVTIFDSNTGEYQTIPVDPNDPFAFRNNNPDIGYFQNSEGDYVYGVVPEQTYTSGNPDDGISLEGVDPNWAPITQPDMNGIGADRQPDGSVGPNAGGQRTPDNTPIGGGAAAGDYTGWQGSSTHDIDGNIIEGSAGDPNSRPTYERSGVPWERSDPFSGVTAGGVQGVGTVGALPTASRDNPLQGYESSSNKDYYQKQFQNMRAQQLGQQDASNAASAYQAPEQAPLGDPWANMNVPDVYVQGTTEGYDPNEMILNPRYEGMTNSAIINSVSDLSVFNDEDRRWFDEVAASPDQQSSYGFIGDRQGVLDRNAAGDMTGQNKNRISSVIDQLYQPQGDLATPGGMRVPVGYASPINA